MHQSFFGAICGSGPITSLTNRCGLARTPEDHRWQGDERQNKTRRQPDRGSQYASQAMTVKLIEYGMRASMIRKGNCWDNAPSESFFNSLKNERVHGTTYATRADAQADLFEYIEVFYNRSRRHSTLGYSSPVRFLENWISKHAAQQSLAA